MLSDLSSFDFVLSILSLADCFHLVFCLKQNYGSILWKDVEVWMALVASRCMFEQCINTLHFTRLAMSRGPWACHAQVL